MAGQRQRVSSNTYANGSNQNSGNMISETPTTRVAKPPGGGSSLNLGWDTEEQAPQRRPAQQQQRFEREEHERVPRHHQQQYDERGPPQQYDDQQQYGGGGGGGGHGGGCEWANEDPHRSPSGPSGGAGGHGGRLRTSGNSFATGANQNAGNVLTDVPSTRVAAPPGGHSSILLGGNPDEGRGGGEPSRGGGQQQQQQQSYARGGGGDLWEVGGRRPMGARPPQGPGQSDHSYNDRSGPPQSPQARSGARGPYPDDGDDHGGGGGGGYGAGSSPQRHGQNSGGYGRGQQPVGGRYGGGRYGQDDDQLDERPGQQQQQQHQQQRQQQQNGPPITRPGPQDHRGGEGNGAYGARPRESSNTFANGQNQNSGNFISDTPSTRVMHAPGGSSSMSLAWDGDNEGGGQQQERHRQQQQQQQQQLQQQQRREQTQQEEYDRREFDRGQAGPGSPHSGPVGRYSPDRHEVGGRSGGRIGYGIDEQPQMGGGGGSRHSRYSPDKQQVGGPGGGRYGTGVSLDGGQPRGGGGGAGQNQVHGARPRESSNSFATGANQNCGNFMTDTPSTRVLQTPGGRSSLSLGWD